jgi:hypothetical protein
LKHFSISFCLRLGKKSTTAREREREREREKEREKERKRERERERDYLIELLQIGNFTLVCFQ